MICTNALTQKNRKSNSIIKSTIKYCFAGLIVLWSLFPIYWMLNNSFKNRAEQFFKKPTFFPHNPTFENYYKLFTDLEFHKILTNSVIVALVSTLIAVSIGALAAYSLSRFQFKAKWLLMGWILMVRIFPPVTFVIPLYTLMGKVNLLNTRTALILSYIVFNLPFAIWMLISFFNEVPIDIEESAMVDGSSHWNTFRKIVFPLVIPGIAATSIFTFMMGWNEFLYAMIFVQTPELVTVPVGLAGLVTEYLVLWGPMSAGGVLSVIPLMIFAFFMQDYLIKGLTAGAVKG